MSNMFCEMGYPLISFLTPQSAGAGASPAGVTFRTLPIRLTVQPVQIRQGDFGRQYKQASPHTGDVYGEAETVQFTIPALPAGCQNPPQEVCLQTLNFF